MARRGWPSPAAARSFAEAQGGGQRGRQVHRVHRVVPSNGRRAFLARRPRRRPNLICLLLLQLLPDDGFVVEAQLVELRLLLLQTNPGQLPLLLHQAPHFVQQGVWRGSLPNAPSGHQRAATHGTSAIRESTHKQVTIRPPPTPRRLAVGLGTMAESSNPFRDDGMGTVPEGAAVRAGGVHPTLSPSPDARPVRCAGRGQWGRGRGGDEG